jgi:hypothetical protein
MSRLRTAATEVLGLFIDNVAEAAAIVVVLALGELISRTTHGAWLGAALGLALCIVLVSFVHNNARRRH